MARTTEMKLHYVTRDGITYEVFYDTHIRLWTATYDRPRDGYMSMSNAGYGINKENAIGECIANNQD